MKSLLQRTTFQMWLLATAALATATVQSIVIQEPETWTLCDQSNGSCEWPTDNVAVKQPGMLDQLLAQLANSPHYRTHITGQMAMYNVPPTSSYAYGRLHSSSALHQQLDPQRQQPGFLFGNWKRHFAGLGGLTTWDAYGPIGPTRSYRPFNSDNKRAPYGFSSWGGKRSSWPLAQQQRIDENMGATTGFEASPNMKREPSFSSWGGKRSPQFFTWGGKRSLPEEALDQLGIGAQLATPTYNGEHTVMKRDVSGEDPLVAAAVAGEPNRQNKRLCISDSTNLRQLLDEFIEWSRKQPEQKKASLYNKMLNVRTLHSSENPSRRAGAFYNWGGKRNSKLKDDLNWKWVL